MLALLFAVFLSGAQAAPDTTAYTVAYIEVAPASRPALVTALKQYREATRKEDGFVRMEFFEQTGRPAHFNIIETWANPKAVEVHAAAASTRQMRSSFDSIRISDYDQRPYKTLSLGTGTRGQTPLPPSAIHVISHVDIGGQGTNAAELLKKLAEESRKEEGNLRFDVLQHAMRANHFTVIETWQTAKAADAHASAAHTKQYRDGIAPIAGSPLDERLFKAVE